jgi:hypothetical protein
MTRSQLPMNQNITLTDVGVLSQEPMPFLRVGALHYIIAPLLATGAVFLFYMRGCLNRIQQDERFKEIYFVTLSQNAKHDNN